MKNDILGGLVIFIVIVTCLLILDDISNPQEKPAKQDTVQIEHLESQKDLAIVESEE